MVDAKVANGYYTGSTLFSSAETCTYMNTLFFCVYSDMSEDYFLSFLCLALIPPTIQTISQSSWKNIEEHDNILWMSVVIKRILDLS